MAGVGLLSVGLALADVGVRYGVPGWAYTATGPALSIYWARRRQSNAVS